MEQGMGIIGLIGLQGSGKSATLQVLCFQLNKEYREKNSYERAFLLHWTPNAIKLSEEVRKLYKVAVIDEGTNIAFSKKRQQSYGDYYNEDKEVEAAELILGRAKCKEIKRQSVIEYLSRMQCLFIDLPDYSKKHKGDMTRDLRNIETLWKTFQSGNYGSCPILVLGIQKEMFEGFGHFFFGKMDIVEIEPLKPNELVNAYRQKWQTFDVITEYALLYIA